MPNSNSKLTWCVASIGDDMNWWVSAISDSVHWDTNGLGIIDPRQFQHLLELMDSLQDYGLDTDLVENAFFAFAIDKIEKDKSVRLRKVEDSILESEDSLFALPDIIDDEKGPYADLLEHLTKLRVKMLNDLIDFSSSLTVEELEEAIRETQNAAYMEGISPHFFTELTAILEFVPEGFELDGDDEEVGEKDEAEGLADALPDMDDEDSEDLEKDDTMKWDEDEDEESEDEDSDNTSDDFEEEDEDER
jgi:hypothetical protein